MTRQIVLDTETTGIETSQGHRIIEIGCVELIDRKITKNNFHVYINPNRLIDAEAEAVHGISNDFLKDKPLFSDVLDDFVEYIKGAELVIHNAPFDVGFLDYEFALQGRELKIANICTVLDTLVLARKKHPGQRNNLDVLCSRYFINNDERVYHGALLDADILAKVYLAMTGGQIDMGLISEATENGSSAQANEGEREDDWQFAVINANAEELDAHNDYLKLLEEKSNGDCLWFPRKEVVEASDEETTDELGESQNDQEAIEELQDSDELLDIPEEFAESVGERMEEYAEFLEQDEESGIEEPDAPK